MAEGQPKQSFVQRDWARVPKHWRPILTGLVIFTTGAFVGASLRAIAGAGAVTIDQYVQGALIAALGAVLAGALAIVGSYWGGHLGAQGASRAAEIAAEAAAASERKAIRERLVILSTEFADHVAKQVARRGELAGGPDDGSMPTIGPIEDYRRGVLELFVRGAQKAADIGENTYRVLNELGKFAYVAARHEVDGQVTDLSDDAKALRLVWERTELIMRTELIDAGLKDEVVTSLRRGGQLERDYPYRRFNDAVRQLKDEGVFDGGTVFVVDGKRLSGDPWPPAAPRR